MLRMKKTFCRSLLPKFVALLVLFAESVLCTNTYDNVAGGDLFVECDPGYGMSQVASSYTTTGGGFGDRRWDWDCRKVYMPPGYSYH